MKITKTKVLIIGGIVVLLSVGGLVSHFKSAKENESMAPPTVGNEKKESTSSDTDREQASLIKRYGDAPSGFKWKDDGTLLSLGDASLTSEEVAYSYLKSASTLDFDSLQRTSSKSTVVKSYNNYYDDASLRNSFQRKMYKNVLKNIVVDKIVDTALFADTKTIYTLKINTIDLSNKDFWKQDKDVIFQNLYTYYRDESDSTKAKQYIYEYILSWYESDSAPKKDVQIELVLEKNKQGAWLVTSDSDLDTLCKYSDGESVSDYIYDSYLDWLDSKYE